MTPSQIYQSRLQQNATQADAGQLAVIRELDRLHGEVSVFLAGSSRWQSSLRKLLGKRLVPPHGLYLWGGVGRGKTFLMDLFIDCLPESARQRTHFHRFMKQVHGRLRELQGTADPLQVIGRELAQQSPVLCLDEFFVLDIGDAMLLAGLLRALFENGAILVTTSNLQPDRLYENGLQRDSFLPAIELLKKNCQVLAIDAGPDYRLRQLESATLYHFPTSPDTDPRLQDYLLAMTPAIESVITGKTLEILGRELQTRMYAEDIAWFDFDQLCRGPRSVFDYVEIARLFHAVILSGLPGMDDSDLDAARRFINLVDEFYDRRVKLIIAAEVPIEAIYQGQRLAFEFERTRSRLLEMQSLEYLRQQHLC